MEAKAAAKSYATREGVAKAVIHIYLPGGIAHQESWDPKPYAPAEYRGPFGAIGTSVDGVQFGETFKEMAKIANKVTVIRSMSHGEAAHERGTHNMFTGYRPSPALKYPCFGSVVAHELGSQNNLPPYMCIPNQPNEFAGSGYLSSAFGPFSLGADPADKGFTVRDLSLPSGVDDARFTRRRNLLDAVDAHFRSMEKADEIESMDSFYQTAYGLISSKKGQEAFDIAKENDKLRDRYGRQPGGAAHAHAPEVGGGRRPAGDLTYGELGSPQQHQERHCRAGPGTGPGLATLISDLDERGMLDSTLVMVSSEFGRTPKINPTDGRDHWPRVFSTLLAGGGVKRGFVYGASDSLGAEPERDPVSVMDFATTVYNQLGITADRETDRAGARGPSRLWPMEMRSRSCWTRLRERVALSAKGRRGKVRK